MYISGEILSYYLSLELGMDNVPPVVLARAQSRQQQWAEVSLHAAGWEEDMVVALILWVNDIVAGDDDE